MHRKTCFGGKYIPRVSFCFKGQQPPIYAQKTVFGEYLQHKPTGSVFAYIFTSDESIITKLHKNIKKVKYYIIIYNYRVWPKSRGPLLNFGTPSISEE